MWFQQEAHLVGLVAVVVDEAAVVLQVLAQPDPELPVPVPAESHAVGLLQLELELAVVQVSEEPLGVLVEAAHEHLVLGHEREEKAPLIAVVEVDFFVGKQ